MRRRSKLALAAFLLICTGAIAQDQQSPAPQAQYLSSFAPGNVIAGFGGLSALEISEDGNRFFVLSDRAILFEGQFARNQTQISDMLIAPAMSLRDVDGQEFRGKSGDSEGLALSKNGNLMLSFEGVPRLSSVPDTHAETIDLIRHTRPDAFRQLPENAALEALAVDENGAYFTLPEDPRDGGDFPVWRYRHDLWDQPFAIARHDGFLAVGADFGPDGMFYLLERKLAFPGFASRIRRFTITGDHISEGEVILKTTPGQHDNLEGISLWRDDQWRIRITMVSDNNYFILQTTEFVEYVMP
ncbi:esterase-like activity of phytase family protein [Halocynthiibacter namhaensis]|uniref:esterase-like activity of phytase family protein n=1 Tax=Halocynthiibacter namhaensis TaxID=1290553 RepID=UPI0005799482|nr:esterase-like activity of phytase family protein [Halocynthiibacter namhaensis]